MNLEEDDAILRYAYRIAINEERAMHTRVRESPLNVVVKVRRYYGLYPAPAG